MFNKSNIALVASIIAAAAAHGTVDVFSANYQDYQGADNWASARNANSAVRQFPADTGYVGGDGIYNPSLISCGSAGQSPTPTVVTTQAGSYVNVHWEGSAGPNGNSWPHPVGAVMGYMAPCDNNDCTSFNSADASYFKIFQDGHDMSVPNEQGWIDHMPAGGSNGYGLWGGTKSMLQEGSWMAMQIPADIPAAQYLLRVEHISYHNMWAPQHYPACIQLNIESSTPNGSPFPALTPAGELYNWESEQVDVYQQNFYYDVNKVGPALYWGASNNGGTNAKRRRHHADASH
ncbi:Cellulose-growth-specific protein [Wallemia ichthyophaga EXF-994]|uniref:lytic cellulose monooxygenase (C4-dehydrogenating) n=1 Tax=Wallemia ichthyophaga (strain EXF-994 / CBS 113033) TaxID=1299270 RepID=R9A9Y6_WALI9|nr:Cellulose-growth-specific protein [Wallemia ichthyophaga EXF-994]EOQ98927.1 Cellulose-growth-specific protein [Wallemia ichthyophaga EXF-994]